MENKIIAIDFDGVIVNENFPNIGELMEGAKDTILELYNMNYDLILWTSRTDNYLNDNGEKGYYLTKALEFLEKEGILHCFKAVNENIYKKHDCRKIYANIYIDDRDINGFKGWSYVREKLLRKED